MITETRNIWYFYSHALYADRKFWVDWGSFNFDKISNKHDRNSFRKSAKDFLRYCLENIQGKGGLTSPGTCEQQSRLFRCLIKWMIDNKIYRFSALDPYHLEDFLKYRMKESRSGSLSSQAIRSYIFLFEKLWDYRFRYANPLVFNPYLSGQLHRIQKISRPDAKWGYIPYETALPLIKDAMNWLHHEGQYLINAIHLHDKLRGNLRGLLKPEMRVKSHQAYNTLRETSEDFKLLEIKLMNVEQTKEIPEILRESIHLSLGAAIAVILLFTGIRVSELLSLQIGCCIKRKHADGNAYWYIKGIAAKKGGMQKEWVVPEPVIETIQFLEKLHTVNGLKNVNNYLFSLPNGVGILPWPYIRVTRLWSSTIANHLRTFARSSTRINPLASTSRLHPHQARKTFAKFVVKRDKRGLEALAQHYGHLYTALLDRTYVGGDFELQDLIDEESQKDLEEGLVDLLTSKKLGGKAGQMLSDIRAEVKHNFRGKQALSAIVKRLISDGVTLAPCDWGYCVYAQDQSACKGNERGPNPVLREPGTCASCSNFAVTETHKSWWEDRAKREENFLKQENLSPQTIEIVNSRLNRTQKILQILNPPLSRLKNSTKGS